MTLVEIAGDDCGHSGDDLAIGTPVRVYRTHRGGSLWLYDPVTQQPADGGYVRGEHVDGHVRERHGDVYRVTVVRDGRELYIDWMVRRWMVRRWVRLPEEAPPVSAAWDK